MRAPACIRLTAMLIAVSTTSAYAGICPFRMYIDEVVFNVNDYTTPNSLCIYPDGRTSLSDAVMGNFNIHYGIALEHMDYDTGWAIYNYPEQGLLLEEGSGTVSLCDTTCAYLLRNQAIAVFGSQPIYGGGHSPVTVGGQPIATSVFHWAPDIACGTFPVALYINSPDINGDLIVNLSDTALFGADAQGSYNYRSDFNWDGAINVSDTAIFAAALGATCQ